MYESANRQLDRIVTPKPVPVDPTITGTHNDSIRKLHEAVQMADALLNKLRGPIPEENRKELEEMPSLMTHAGKINLLASEICMRLNDMHRLVGE